MTITKLLSGLRKAAQKRIVAHSVDGFKSEYNSLPLCSNMTDRQLQDLEVLFDNGLLDVQRELYKRGL